MLSLQLGHCTKKRGGSCYEGESLRPARGQSPGDSAGRQAAGAVCHPLHYQHAGGRPVQYGGPDLHRPAHRLSGQRRHHGGFSADLREQRADAAVFQRFGGEFQHILRPGGSGGGPDLRGQRLDAADGGGAVSGTGGGDLYPLDGKSFRVHGGGVSLRAAIYAHYRRGTALPGADLRRHVADPLRRKP